MLANSKFITTKIDDGTLNKQEKDKEVTEQNRVITQFPVLSSTNSEIPSRVDVYTNIAKTPQAQLIHSIDTRKEQNRNIGGVLNKEGKYDPYKGFLYEHGLLSDQFQTRYTTFYYNIDSRDRQKTPYNTTDTKRKLATNPLNFTANSNVITITDPDHNFVVGDKIQLLNITPVPIRLRTKVGLNYGIVFVDGSAYVKINYEHSLPSSYSGTYIEVTIQGFNGTTSITKFNNIPINLINRKHTVYLISDSESYSASYFFIKLPIEFSGTFTIQNYNIILTFNSIAGIPTHYLNADYPININRHKGFHIVRSITTTTYTINLLQTAIYTTIGGGNNINVAKIISISEAYPDQHSYRIYFKSPINNIVSIRLVSSEFPNSGRIVKNHPINDVNNKIYWQILNDGDYVYSASITSGNYTVTSIASVIQTAINSVERIENITTDSTLSSTTTVYDNYNNMTISLDIDTSIMTFKLYKKATIIQPIDEISPDIPLDSSNDTSEINTYILTIQQTNHNLTVGDSIIISNAIATNGIPASVINNTHEITAIVDENHYHITLPKFNLESTRPQNHGGVNVVILTPEIFRLRFDYSDTLGKMIGFRNVGESTSITQYGTSITNNDSYENEESINSIGETIVIENNALDLHGDSYILLQSEQLSTMLSTGTVDKIFAKIQLSDVKGETLYNTFVSSAKYFYDPIALTHLDFSFHDADGDLYDFNGINHSFTLEIVTVNDSPINTGISAKTGKLN